MYMFSFVMCQESIEPGLNMHKAGWGGQFARKHHRKTLYAQLKFMEKGSSAEISNCKYIQTLPPLCM